MGAMEDTEFFLKNCGTFYEKGPVGNGVLQLMTKTPDQAGNCLFCLRN